MRFNVAVIAGVLEVECVTVDEVMSYLERGSTYRHTGLTRMNEHSSRSHSVFTLVIGSSRSHLPFTDCLEHFIPVINCRALYIVTGQYMSTAVINDEMHHSAHCHYQSVDVHSFCQLIRRHSFWSHPSFRAFCWPETDEVYLWHHFYCATPCIVWTMLLQDVCLSVRLSKRFNLSSDFITIG